MRANQIRVEPFEFIDFQSIIIQREVGSHGIAQISGKIFEDHIVEYENRLSSQTWVTMKSITDTGETVTLFAGVVSSFSMDCFLHTNILTLEVMSGTFLMDGANHFRSFQNQNQSYSNVIDTIHTNYSDISVKGVSQLNSSIRSFLFQYLETDWQFIQRLSSSLGLFLTPNVEQQEIRYYIGNPQKTSHHIVSENISYTIKKSVQKFMKRSANGLGAFEENQYLEYEITTRELYNLWDEVTFVGGDGIVFSLYSEYVKGELLHTYLLRTSSVMQSMPVWNTKQIGCSVMGTVEDVKQDVVQISIQEDENLKQENRIWFSFSTNYSSLNGAGWYFMPEIGDMIRLYFPTEREQDAYVISAVHQGEAPERQNPDYKSIKTKYGKQLLMTPTSIVLTNNDGMKIELQDGYGISIQSDKDIRIQSSGNLTLSSEQSSLLLAGTSQVDVVQNGASIHLDDKITFKGSKFRIQ